MIIERAKEVLAIESDAISSLITRIDSSFVDAVEILDSCTGRVVFTGMGKSGIIGKKIASTFASIGTPAFFLHPAEGVHGDLGMLTNGDVVITLSNSGETSELISIIPTIKRLGIKLISITGNTASPLAELSDVVLDVSIKEEACSWDIVPTSSTTAALAMGDALAIVLMEKKEIKKEDFALFHPGGALGKNILLRVEDLMITGKNLPTVSTSASFGDVVNEISLKGKGVAVVVSDDNKLKGIITDGDLRRAIQKKVDLSLTKAEHIFSGKPRTIEKSSLAVRCIRIMEEFSITSLVIIDDNCSPIGLIHLHDILKAGIV